MSVASYHQHRGTSNNSSANYTGGSINNNNNNSHNYNIGDVSNGSTAGSVRLAGENTKDRMYEPKHHQKAVRVLTVIAYIFFVSLAAIMLSLYYVILWNPPPPQPNKLSTGSGGNTKNGTDCNHGGVMTEQTVASIAALETPKAMPVVNDRNDDSDKDNFVVFATTEMNSDQFYNNDNSNINNDNSTYTLTMDDNNYYYKDKTYNYTIKNGGNTESHDSDTNYNNNDNDNYYII